MLLKDRSPNGHSCVYTLRFPVLTANWDNSKYYLLTVTLAVTGAGRMINVNNYVISFTKHSRHN